MSLNTISSLYTQIDGYTYKNTDNRVYKFIMPVADPWGPRGPGPPIPVKTSQKKDGRRTGLQVLLVIGPPSSDKFLDPLLNADKH